MSSYIHSVWIHSAVNQHIFTFLKNISTKGSIEFLGHADLDPFISWSEKIRSDLNCIHFFLWHDVQMQPNKWLYGRYKQMRAWKVLRMRDISSSFENAYCTLTFVHKSTWCGEERCTHLEAKVVVDVGSFVSIYAWVQNYC